MFDSAVLLVADADDQRRSFLADQMRADGACVYMGQDRVQTVARAATHRPDALVLGDLDSASGNIEVLRAVRGSSGLPSDPSADLPVVALVDAADQLAVLRAFHAGADDVTDSGTDYAVLRARLLVLLGRAGSRACAPTVKIGALEVSHAQRRAWLHGEPLALSGKEFELLAALAADPQRVFGRDELLRDIWAFHAGARTRTLDTHASRLRRKLRVHGDELVVNVWGVGYSLVNAVPDRGRWAA